jgi:uncharacterized membrane protein YkoI
VNRRTLLLGLALACAGGAKAYADERDEEGRHDHDRAHRALLEGRARPLAEILDRVVGEVGGEVVGVDFERKQGRYVYELKVITTAGRLREVYVDAMTAEILESEDDD